MKILSVLFLSLVAQAASAQTVPILMFHKLVPNASAPAHEDVQLGRFEEYLKMIKVNGYKTLTISELTSLIRSKSPLPSKAVAITFDDGWRADIEAEKLLLKYNQKATFYILSGAFDDPSYLSKADLQSLSANNNVEIGAHTQTHFMKWVDKLDALDTKTIVDEMSKSKTQLEQVIKKPILSFSWPFGYVRDDAEKQAPAMGYTSIVQTNNSSKNGLGTSTLQLERLNIDGSCTSAQVKKMIDTGVLDKCK